MEWELEYLSTEKELENGYGASRWAEIHTCEGSEFILNEFKSDCRSYFNEGYRYRLIVWKTKTKDWATEILQEYPAVKETKFGYYLSNYLDELLDLLEDIKTRM